MPTPIADKSVTGSEGAGSAGGSEGVHPVPGYVKDNKGVVWTIEQYETNRRRALEAAGAGGGYGGGSDVGQRFVSALNARFTDEMMSKMVNTMFGGGGGGGGTYGVITEIGKEFARGLGIGVSQKVNTLLDRFIPADMASNQAGGQQVGGSSGGKGGDINRQLIETHDQGGAPVREVIPSFGGSGIPQQQTYEEFLLSLSTDDNNDLEKYSQRKGYYGIPIEETKRLLMKEQKALRESMSANLGGRGGGVVTGDTWTNPGDEYKPQNSESGQEVKKEEQSQQPTTTPADLLIDIKNLIEKMHEEIQAQKQRLDKLDGGLNIPVLHDEIKEQVAPLQKEDLTDESHTLGSASSGGEFPESKIEVVDENPIKRKFTIKKKVTDEKQTDSTEHS